MGLTVLTFRHHIHVICDCLDSSVHLMHDCLSLFFEQGAYVTSDLFLVRPESASYSWNCINACDFAIMIIGGSYGTLTNTGVSQLHVSYLNAKTKNKPLVVFIKESSHRPRQLHDLIGVIKQQVPISHIYDFNEYQDLNHLVKSAYTQLQNTTQPPSVVLGVIDTEDKQDMPKVGDVLTIETPSKKLATSKYRRDSFSPQLQDELVVNCNAHAFKGGTLIEVAFMASTSWCQVLQVLAANIAPFSSQGMWRMLNELVSTQAMGIVQTTHPDVHAISRCQVTKADILWIREILIEAHWIEKSSTAKEAWKITELAKNLLKNH